MTAKAPPVSRNPDPAIVDLARALARMMAREDHAREVSTPSEDVAPALPDPKLTRG